MPRKRSSHFVAHVVTAFVDRLTEAIHELAAARAHSEVLSALGGARPRDKIARRSRVVGARAESAQAETSKKKPARKATRKATKKARKKATARLAEKKVAKTTTPATRTAGAKSKVKAATRTRASEERVKGKGAKPRPRPTAGALQAEATKKNESAPNVAPMPKATPVASPAPASSGAPPVPPGAVLSSEDTPVAVT